MKRLLLGSLLLLGSIAAKAYDFPYLTLKNIDGTTQTLSVDGLVITFADGRLVVGSGDKAFVVADLSLMLFSQTGTADVVTGIETADTYGGQEAVEVFSVRGMSMGKFDSVAEARKALRPGVYVMKTASRTFKTTVK